MVQPGCYRKLEENDDKKEGAGHIAQTGQTKKKYFRKKIGNAQRPYIYEKMYCT